MNTKIVNDPFEIKNRIAYAIKNGIVKKRIKQKDLAVAMRKSPAAISEWINGHKVPGGEDLVKLVELLDLVSVLFLKQKISREENFEEEEITRLEQKMHTIEEKLTEIENNIGLLKLV